MTEEKALVQVVLIGKREGEEAHPIGRKGKNKENKGQGKDEDREKEKKKNEAREGARYSERRSRRREKNSCWAGRTAGGSLMVELPSALQISRCLLSPPRCTFPYFMLHLFNYNSLLLKTAHEDRSQT